VFLYQASNTLSIIHGQITNISPITGELESIDWKVIPVDSTTKEAPEFARIYRKYAPLLTELAKPVGRTSVALDARSLESRTQETNIGNFIADAFRKSTAADIGDGYTMFKGSTVIIPPERAPIDVDVVKRAIGTRAIAPKVEGRIRRLDVARKSGANCN
jgi:2',3'-cyclic-nucleotide 2'-phosphodiesterase (5'-nucleotidase family)